MDSFCRRRRHFGVGEGSMVPLFKEMCHFGLLIIIFLFFPVFRDQDRKEILKYNEIPGDHGS